MIERSPEGWRTDPRLRQTRMVILNEGDTETKRAEIRQYFHDTFDLDEALYEIPKYDETFYLRADPLRHPLIFYLGHTASFYINKLVTARIIQTRINPAYESMFAIGVDEMSWDDLDDAHYDWPTVEAVQAYRDAVRARVDEVIRTLPLTLPIEWESPWWVIMMGIEHARIHIETSSVLIRQLPLDHVRPHPLWPICRQWGPAPHNEMLNVPGGRVSLGKSRQTALYGWDNEFGAFGEQVHPFAAARYLVSNGEYLEFVMDAEGYGTRQWWTEEGWSWREYARANQPRFWRRDGETFRLRTVAEEIDMPWDWPVEVNYLEAKAFCNWMAARNGKPVRLPTETEWYRLRDLHVETDQPYWAAAPGNINLEYFASSCPVTHFAFGDFHDVIGNVWQWTETPISGFAGFAVHPVYDDFSTPTFDTRHNLIKGGSWASTGNEATRDARYAFRRHFYQHAGFRPIVSDQPVVAQTSVYESDPLVAMYCESHYGRDYFGVPNFPAAMARLCLELTESRPRRKALDLGCAVGRSSFELARRFESVMGLDFSARFIRIGDELKATGSIRYTCVEEGELVSYHEAGLAELGLEATSGRVEFQQADACNMKPHYAGYDLVLAANLIDRLYDPRKFLEAIHERVNPGGLLVVASPYTWDTTFTQKDKWLGGLRVDGEIRTTGDALREMLSVHFREVGQPRQVPFVIRETAHKFQHTLSEVTVWERREA